MGETMTAEERRERRRRKVLENSESRINRILGGEEGDEKRLAPMMEGGDFHSSKIAASMGDSGSFRSNSNTSVSATEGMSVPQFESDMPWFVRSRVITSIIVGILLRLCVQVGLLTNALLPWLVFQVTLEVYNAFFSKSRKVGGYPAHGYIVNTALYLGFDETTCVYGGIVLDVLCRFMADTSVAFVAFFAAHLVIDQF